MPTATELVSSRTTSSRPALGDRREMLNLRFQLATGQLDNYSRFNVAKRNVARVLRCYAIGRSAGRRQRCGARHPRAPGAPARRRPETTDDDSTAEFGAVVAETDEIEEIKAALATDTDADEEDE